MEKRNYPVYEFVFDPEKFPDDGLTAISIVTDPAIQSKFILLKEDKIKEKFKVQDEREQLIMGPVLIPGMQILRQNRITGEYYYGIFKTETIKEMVDYYFTTNRINNFTYQHKDKIVSGINLRECWFVDGKNDKSKSFGFDLPVNTFFATLKVHDKELWNQINEDGLDGFSIEAFLDCIPFDLKSVDKPIDDDQLKLDQIIKLLKQS
jgi:hypothetical protein